MTLTCPHGHGALTATLAEARVAFRCRHCAGVWLPANTLDEIATSRQLDIHDLQATLARGGSDGKPLTCAAGHATRTTLVRSLELDWCPTCHGVWFDAGELQRLLEPRQYATTTAREVAETGAGEVVQTFLGALLNLFH
jgi:Zn-finger nucleic acid-binding protein